MNQARPGEKKTEEDRLTPMFAQYKSVKKKYPDALLFFRMGDFYEMFFEDAVVASRELQLTLTSRGKGAASAPMCGVPWHASQSYLAQLIDRGYSVAICEQIEDPKTAKGLVRREVTCVVTPGTVLEESSLDARRHNYLGAVFCGLHETCAFAWADISTGQWSGVQFKRQDELWQWVAKLAPSELIIMDGRQIPQGANLEKIRISRQPAASFDLKRSTERLLAVQNARELGALGLESRPDLVRACGAILCYLEQTQPGQISRLMPFKPLDLGKRMIIDEFTARNLELFVRLNGQKGKGTLIHLLDNSITPMGARLLEDMLQHPFRDLRPIRKIQEAVAWFFTRPDLRAHIRKELARIGDLERTCTRICLSRCKPGDLISLKQALVALGPILDMLMVSENLPPVLADALSSADNLQDIAGLLQSALSDSPPATFTETGLFREGYNAELDRQLDLINNAEQNLKALLEREQKNTGIAKLRLGNNRVFGYYYEAPRSAFVNGVPEHFIRRQSLANAERYTSEELKKLEEDILLASGRAKELENEMLQALTSHILAQKDRIMHTAQILASIDYWQSLAETAHIKNWAMPELNESTEIHIHAGRHPVIEAAIGSANFMPNDFHMTADRRFCLLTGPNMAGKSTILRQTAIISILAQIGSMVPADHAQLGLVDRLFSRVGASDNLAQGQSTFMVEMMETARILRQATRRSLIILDEIGRGTSTFDGMAIAWAVTEDLLQRCQKQLRVIFATHYHELTALEGRIEGLFTMNIAVGAYDNKEILFLHKLLPGPSDKSYGVEVARLAGIPYPVVQRARELLKELEGMKPADSFKLPLPGLKKKSVQFTDIIEELRELPLDALTLEQATAILKRWQRQLKILP